MGVMPGAGGVTAVAGEQPLPGPGLHSLSMCLVHRCAAFSTYFQGDVGDKSRRSSGSVRPSIQARAVRLNKPGTAKRPVMRRAPHHEAVRVGDGCEDIARLGEHQAVLSASNRHQYRCLHPIQTRRQTEGHVGNQHISQRVEGQAVTTCIRSMADSNPRGIAETHCRDGPMPVCSRNGM